MQKERRYELKFVVEVKDKDEVFLWLYNSVGLFKKAHDDRRVNNIYFDHSNLSSLEDNLSGISRRQKMRYRWYGNNVYPIDGYMEVKNKDNNLGWKNHYKVENLHINQKDSWKEIISKIISNSEELQILSSQYFIPTLCNRYDRQYFESHDTKVRITIDLNIEFYQQNSLTNPNFTNKSYSDDLMIIECKFDEDSRKLAHSIIDKIPVRRSRYSKYASGAFCNY
jgi:SPX domain protein involved in polyphosphate accumulation